MNHDFDPAKLAEAAIEADLDPSVFEQIDETDLRWPSNFFQWINNSDFLGIKPFPKQIEIGINFFGQFCPRCTDPGLMEDERWGNKLLDIPVDLPMGEIVDRVTFLENDVCPQCNVNHLELLASKELNHYSNLNGCAGQRSSKTTLVGGMICTYSLARVLQLKNPAQFFGLLPNQMLHGTFVAITAGQAQETLWQAFKDRIDSSPWFHEYHAFLTQEAHRLGKQKFHDANKETFLSYSHKQLVVSFSGPDIRTIRGRTRIFSGLDEKGWFDVQADSGSINTKVRLNAKETTKALMNSLQTVRASAMSLRAEGILSVPEGINADVSSPSSLNDSIMRGIRQANEDPTIYPFHYATWEMNPNLSLASLRSEMLSDRRSFDRDFAAVPPLGANQFIESQMAVEKCQGSKSQTALINWTKRYHQDEFGDKTMYVEVNVMKKDRHRPRMLTVDTGLSNNSFAVTLWSYDREEQRPVCDIAIECMPEETQTEKILVNFPMMFRHAILPLVEGYRVILAAYDRWQSIDQVQRLRTDHRVEAVQYQLKWADFQAIRATILDSNLRIPLMEISIDDVRKSDKRFDDIIRSVPVAHLALQMLTVREGGRKVIKPINGTDDLFRCLCLAVKFILDPKYTRKFEQYGSGAGVGQKIAGVVRRNYSGPANVHAASPTRPDSQVGLRKSFVGSLK